MKPEIVLLARIHGPTVAELKRTYVVHDACGQQDTVAFMRQFGARARGVVTNSLSGCSSAQMDALPALEIISSFGNPRKTVDLEAAAGRGIVVTNTPDYITDSVADVALGLLLSVLRRIGECDRFVRAGRWERELPPLGRDLRGKRCGIVGLGKIGRAVAKRVEVCGMTVCYQGPRPKADVSYAYYADLHALAKNADCLIVACPATPETRHLVDGGILDALGPDGFLVNISRGSVVDEGALIAALRDGRIAGAGLDVFQDEPRVPDSFKGLENVVLTPHIGSTTREIREERGRKLLANLAAHFAGKPVLNRFTGTDQAGNVMR